jgi:hypothetical protein
MKPAQFRIETADPARGVERAVAELRGYVRRAARRIAAEHGWPIRAAWTSTTRGTGSTPALRSAGGSGRHGRGRFARRVRPMRDSSRTAFAEITITSARPPWD